MPNLIPVSNLTEINEEPRVLDTLLAERLQFDRLTSIRVLIERNREELESYGSLHQRDANPGKQGGRPGKAYYLNEGQALVICALSRTTKAAQVRKMLIDVFMAYRQGKLVHVQEHRRTPPQRAQRRQAMQFTYEENKAFIRANIGGDERQVEYWATMATRLQNLEIAMFGELKTARALGNSAELGNGRSGRMQ